MDRQAVSYAGTSDDLSIAYARFGAGPTIVFASNTFGDLQTNRLTAYHTLRHTNGLVKAGWQVVRYDMRGMGLSSQDVTAWDLSSRMKDLEAVVEALGLQRFVLAGFDVGAATAVTYAAAHPKLVARLVLINSWSTGYGRYQTIEAARTMISLKELALRDWPEASLMFANRELTFEDPASAREFAATIRRSTSPENWLACRQESESIDLTGILPSLAVQTRVIHSKQHRFSSQALCEDMAARIPGAEFVSVSSADDVEAIAEFIQSVRETEELKT